MGLVAEGDVTDSAPVPNSDGCDPIDSAQVSKSDGCGPTIEADAVDSVQVMDSARAQPTSAGASLQLAESTMSSAGECDQSDIDAVTGAMKGLEDALNQASVAQEAAGAPATRKWERAWARGVALAERFLDINDKWMTTGTFPLTDIKAAELVASVWKAVRRLERVRVSTGHSTRRRPGEGTAGRGQALPAKMHPAGAAEVRHAGPVEPERARRPG